MSNIFQLSEQWRMIQDMADELDEQTLKDTLDSIEEPLNDKITNAIAVIKSIKGDIEFAKKVKRDIDDRIAAMEGNKKRLTDLVLYGVDNIGQPKKDNPDFKKLMLSNPAIAKSAWTQLNPPRVNIVDERLVPAEFKEPQPDKIVTKDIAATWKEITGLFEEQRAAVHAELQAKVDSEKLSEEDATDQLNAWERENAPRIGGVEVEQTVGVRFR